MVYPNITLSLLLVNLLAVTGKITFSSKVKFAEPIEVEFKYKNATIHDYIGIYDYNKGDDLSNNPFNETLQYYTYFCASQTKELCTALTAGKGSVAFNGVDPSEEYYDQWPLNPRTYKLCHMREGYVFVNDTWTGELKKKETGELIGKCKKLKVKLSRKRKEKIKNDGYVLAEKSYKEGDKIEISFNSVMKSQNSWIGIYQKNITHPTNEKYMWVYTGCDNVLGDQINIKGMSNDCIEKKKKGKVTFGPDNTGRAALDWPPPPGEYYIRLNYYNNDPHDFYIAGNETFTIDVVEY